MRGRVSEQMSLESFAEDGEWLCCPDVGWEFVPPQTPKQRRVALRWAALFALSDGVTSRPADVGEQSAHAGTCGLPVFGGRQVQFIDVYDRAELDVGCSRKPLEATEELRHMGEFG